MKPRDKQESGPGDENELARLKKVQDRINSALVEPDDEAQSDFSPFGKVEGPNFARQMMLAAVAGGLEGIEAALDKFDHLSKDEDKHRLRYAMMNFLAHYPDAPKLGLRIPSLEERSPWKATPSKKAK